MPARDGLVEAEAELEEVRPHVEILVAQLLGRHVGRRSDRRSVAGEAPQRLGLGCIDARRRKVAALREAEVE